MRILLLCHKMPFPLHDGGAVSSYYTALGLSKNEAEVTLLAVNTPKSWVNPDAIPIEFNEKVKFEHSVIDTRIKPIQAFTNIFSNQSFFVDRFKSKQFKADLINMLSNNEFDIVHIEHIYLCLYIETIQKYSKAKIVLRPQNIESQVWKRIVKLETRIFRKAYLKMATNRLEKYEKRMAKAVDGIIAISKHDDDLFKNYAPQTTVTEIPPGYNFENLKAHHLTGQNDHFPVYFHLGSMDWQPNIQGIKWFITKVMPVIIDNFPGFTFRIAGKNMPAWVYIYQSKNLVIDGEVEDAYQYLEDKQIMIVPILSGGGIRIKIIEGMAMGKTIISTTIGAEGIPYTDGINILIADDIKSFVNQITRCASSETFCNDIGKQAQKLATKQYNYLHTTAKMIRFYETLLARDI